MLTYIKLFTDSLALLDPLTDAERGRLLTALLEYARAGNPPELEGNERFLFPVFRQQLDREQENYERLVSRQRANGAKGGRPPKACDGAAPEGQETQKSQDKDQDKDQEKEKGHVQDDDKDNGAGGGRAAGPGVVGVVGSRLGILSDRAKRELEGFLQDMGPECVRRALDAAEGAGRLNWGYVRGVLARKREQGARSAADWDRLEQERRSARPGAQPIRCSPPGTDYQPDAARIARNQEWLDRFLSEQLAGTEAV